MVYFFSIFLPVFLAAILQVSLFPCLFPSGVSPDALLMVLVFWVTRSNFERSWFRMVFLGIISDLFSFFPIGTSIISFSLVSFGLSSLSKRFLVRRQTWNSPVLWSLIVLATLANSLFLFIWMSLIGNGIKMGYFPSRMESFNFLAPWDARVFLRIIPNALFFFLIYRPMEKLEKLAEFHNSKIR